MAYLFVHFMKKMGLYNIPLHDVAVFHWLSKRTNIVLWNHVINFDVRNMQSSMQDFLF